MDRIKLGVNIDHVATLRQARGTRYPDVVEAAELCEGAGAEGITIHLREDRRHIQDTDLFRLRSRVKTVLNLEMACSREIGDIARTVQPDEVCLVPEKREELTTEGGLDAAGKPEEVGRTVELMQKAGSLVSLFIDPEEKQIDAAVRLGAPCVELHTGSFCNAFDGGETAAAEEEIERLKSSAVYAHDNSLQVNAGHGINLHNIAQILRIPYLDTLNIGHSIVSRAVFVGLGEAVNEMQRKMSHYDGGDNR
jgi:pyridoxine 5-phosphate synthase